MLLIPAIDLKDGRCVRLKQGNMEDETVFSEDPGEVARHWVEMGAERIHLVDLNGAVSGKPQNAAAIKAILEAVGAEVPVQLGGGIRSLAHVESWLGKGLSRVILGTVALRDPELVKTAARRFPGRIAVGIDARGGKVAVEGWAETSELDVIEMARRFEGAGVAAIIYTDIDRDGVLAGVNWESTLELARAVTIPVIASGGLASMDDIERLSRPECQILEGAISGRALYDGRIDPKAALAALRGVAA